MRSDAYEDAACAVTALAIIGWLLPGSDIVRWSVFVMVITLIWVAAYAVVLGWFSGQDRL